MNDVVKIVPTLSDAELAKAHKKLIEEASKPLMEAMTAALKDGFVTQLTFGENGFKCINIQHFALFKLF